MTQTGIEEAFSENWREVFSGVDRFTDSGLAHRGAQNSSIEASERREQRLLEAGLQSLFELISCSRDSRKKKERKNGRMVAINIDLSLTKYTTYPWHGGIRVVA